MPLPDERPRQSVQNLIGRFEQQTKRQSLAGAVPLLPRTTSVSTQNTGDSVREEAKEKRDWSPKTSDAKPQDSKSPTATHPVAVVRKTASYSETPPPYSPVNEPVIAEPANIDATTMSVSASEVLSTPSEPESINAASIPPPATVVTPPRTSAKLSSSRSAPISRVPPSPAKTSLSKSPPSSSTRLPTPAKPLKAQNTGQSTTSNTSTVRSKSQARAPPVTPSKSKTPTPAARPKTPSSGLYAPTAASLARSRGAAPPVPTPTRKATSSAALERLSKPTAASASKARTPVPTASPVRGGKLPTRGSTPVRGTVKPRVGLAPARVKQDREQKEKESAAVRAGKAVAGGDTIVPAADGLETEAVHDGVDEHVEDDAGLEQGTNIEEHEPLENVAGETHPDDDVDVEIESYDEDFVDDSTQHLALHKTIAHEEEGAPLEADAEGEVSHASEPEPETQPLAHDASSDAPHPDEEHEVSGDPEGDIGTRDVSSDLHHAADIVEPEPLVAPETPAGGNDIEDIVNLLESTPISRRPPSIASIPDDDDE